VLDDCPRMFPPRESSYWIYIASAERLEHLSMANNPYFGEALGSSMRQLY
jgi:hypothetical protein